MTLSADLCLGTVDAIVERLALVEQIGDGPNCSRDLRSPMVPEATVGSVRIYRRSGVADLVYVGLTVAMIGLDSHMMFAFTPPESAVPHFTLDSVASGPPPGVPAAEAGPGYAFHLDLIPKVDLGANLGYLRHCFEPLTALRAEAQQISGLSAAHLSPTQYAVMSAWMLVHRADASAFAEIGPAVAAYRNHWFSLIEHGVPAELVSASAAQLSARDHANRSIVFDPTVDPVWGRVTQLLGAEQAESIRSLLAKPLS